MNKLIYGKDETKCIVGSEVKDNYLVNYIAQGNKTVTEKRKFYYYILTQEYDNKVHCIRLDGKNDFQYAVKFENKQDAHEYSRKLERNGKKYWKCYNAVESAMLREGFTFYKGMKVNDVSVLSFDIETTGVTIDENSFVLLISNTYRDRSGVTSKRLFSFDDYDTPKLFIENWCKWVRELDPDIICGHNIFGFDFPYLVNFAKLQKTKIILGRNASKIEIDRNPRKFRKDGSQQYDYNNVRVFGREVIDTMFLSYKYDIQRNYPSYGLKAIIAHEGLEKENRQFWDFRIKSPWLNPSDWSKFKQYAKDDADDALALYDLMIPQYFYYAQSIPKPFQEIINTATGSQVNSFMVRSYLQESKAIPEASGKVDFEGAISIGNPGIYYNVFKLDVASLYPSIMLQYNISDKKKDPDNNFLRAVEFFTNQRLENKRLASDTGDRMYKDLSNGQKIMINSFYGFLGAPGLNFNYPEGAAEVTRQGRAILSRAIQWCKDKSYKLVNADTDSISYEAPKNSSIYEHLEEINRLYPNKIRFENDGVYESLLVCAAKNYALKKNGEITIKGSGLKATMKEVVLKNFIKNVIMNLLDNTPNNIIESYNKLAFEIDNGISDISPWCSKKTITKSVLSPTRTNESRILDAVKNERVQEGDKILVFFETPERLCLDKDYKGIYDKDILFNKLYKTVEILSSVLDITLFPNYKLRRNKKLLETLRE